MNTIPLKIPIVFFFFFWDNQDRFGVYMKKQVVKTVRKALKKKSSHTPVHPGDAAIQ